MSKDVPFEITVSGEAEIPHPAERALIHVSVSSTGENKVSVVDDVVTTSKHIESMLRELSPKDESAEAKEASPLAHWNKTSMTSNSWMPRDDDGEQKPPRQHKATVKFDIRFKEFKALGAFGTRVSSMPHVEVSGIDWILTPATEEAYRPQLRRDSAKDAMQKAKDYCEVLGCTNLRPVELTEDGHYPRARTYGLYSQELGGPATASKERTAPEDLEFRPQEVKMTKEVTIRFHADAVGGGSSVALR